MIDEENSVVGLSKREYVATQLLAAMLSDPNRLFEETRHGPLFRTGDPEVKGMLVRLAIKNADELLARCACGVDKSEAPTSAERAAG